MPVKMQLSRRLTEKDAAAAQSLPRPARIGQKSLAEAEAKSNKLAANVLEAHKRRAEIDAANCRIHIMSSRAAAAEALLAQTRRGLVARAEEKNLVLTENSRLSRCLAESDVAVDTAWSQVEQKRR